ncbi:MAG: 4-(cytidine 5'-diphospho)-2-C-methyl-D-erythritol kinase [Vicinamibacterales bacterium]
MRTVRLRAHAKINLSLRITGTRPDGYHDLRTVYQTLALHDEVTLVERPGPFVIECDDWRVPRDRSNLVWRAAALLWSSTGREGDPQGVAVSIVKRIPVQGGLGGGSSDAAAALRGLAALWGVDTARDYLVPLGARVGADVAFFLVGGAALGLDRGDQLYPLADLRPLAIVLLMPAFGVSTADAYGWFDAWRGSGTTIAPRGAGRVPCEWPPSAALVTNDLEAPVVARHPAIGEYVALLREAGAEAAAMSGSGSTVFGVFASMTAARAAAAAAARRGIAVIRTKTIGRDEYARSSRARVVSRRTSKGDVVPLLGVGYAR